MEQDRESDKKDLKKQDRLLCMGETERATSADREGERDDCCIAESSCK